MCPRYSVLLVNQSLPEYQNRISDWLHVGIKVLWFGRSDDVAALKTRYIAFSEAFLLQAYVVDPGEKALIIDGKDPSGIVDSLGEQCATFNAEQFKVEHCAPDDHIVVQASAGTGKTKVMIDRILFLMHMVDGLDMSEIFMITFTNEAADQMGKRLQDELITRYRLTKQVRYVRWLEQQSQMNISTIHSFAYKMLKEYGVGESFTDDLAIRSFVYEKQELVKNTIDEKANDGQSIVSQLGVPFYRASDIVQTYWDGIIRLGISRRDLMAMDWGKPINRNSAALHTLLMDIIERLDEQYFDIQRQNNAVSVEDIMRDLQEVLMDPELPTPDLSMKYLFIDEFQDSDLSQIKIACLLVKLLGPMLFVVGDVKQSIYRFRGATDQAFLVLQRDMAEMQIPATRRFSLSINYRTAAGVLKNLDSCFKAWGEIGRLQYEKPVLPCNAREGRFQLIPGAMKEEADDQIAKVISDELDRLIAKVQASGKAPTEKDRVVVLTRSNRELKKVGRILRKARIPAKVQREGSFYASEAVRDFYLMVSSFMFEEEPKHIFNYLMTPYAGEIDSLDINAMERLGGDHDDLVDYLDHFLEQTTWKKYHKALRLRPILSVVKEMLDKEAIIEHFIERSKTRKREIGWPENRCLAATFTEARQYQANLEKLMTLLQQNLGGDRVSLYDLYNFLKINIATNRAESEAVVQSNDDYTSVLCMTVHKAKGLEFDTVVLPYTNRSLGTSGQAEILIDPLKRQIGWIYSAGGDRQNTSRTMQNDLYDELQPDDEAAALLEEARILYVAMTRAIDSLLCIVPEPRNEFTWAYLLRMAGGDP